MANGHGGRRKGSGRKRERDPWALTDGERVNLLEYCKSKGYDPVADMVDIATDPNTSTSMRLAADREVAKYVHPTLGKLDLQHSGKDGKELSSASDKELQRRLDELRGSK